MVKKSKNLKKIPKNNFFLSKIFEKYFFPTKIKTLQSSPFQMSGGGYPERDGRTSGKNHCVQYRIPIELSFNHNIIVYPDIKHDFCDLRTFHRYILHEFTRQI